MDAAWNCPEKDQLRKYATKNGTKHQLAAEPLSRKLEYKIGGVSGREVYFSLYFLGAYFFAL